MSRRTFHAEIVATMQKVATQAQTTHSRAQKRKAQQQQARIVEWVKEHLPLVKKQIRAAALRKESFIDGFPTGLLGQSLLDALGPGFHANLETRSIVGVSDGQGWPEGPYISQTRLMWSTTLEEPTV